MKSFQTGTEAGPHPELLDTRATVHLAARRAEEALRDLRQAVAEAPAAAKYLHLAQAHLPETERRRGGSVWGRSLRAFSERVRGTQV